jgi:hypothetical protein
LNSVVEFRRDKPVDESDGALRNSARWQEPAARTPRFEDKPRGCRCHRPPARRLRMGATDLLS